MPPESRRNFRLGVYNGILMNGAEAFFHSSLVLAPFLAALGAPALIIGFIPALRVGGWFLPQLFVASRLAHQPYKLPWYRRMSVVRVVAYSLMIGSIFLFQDYPLIVMLMVLSMIAVISVAGGVSGIPFADVTAKVVPHNRLGTFWALRNVLGGVLALGAGLMLRYILASDMSFPENFGLIFALGAVMAAVAYLTFSIIHEPSGKAALKEPFLSMLGRVPKVLKQDVSFRRYLRVRFLALLAVLADPFFAVYAIQVLDAPATALGLFVMMSTMSSMTANLLFRRPADRGRNVTVLQISIALMCAAPVCAFLLPSWQTFIIVFMFSAAGQAGMNIAAWNLLYAVAPEAERPLYVGTANSILALPSFAPIFAGGLIDLFGFRPMFVLAAILALVALAFAFRFQSLKELDRRALEA